MKSFRDAFTGTILEGEELISPYMSDSEFREFKRHFLAELFDAREQPTFDGSDRLSPRQWDNLKTATWILKIQKAFSSGVNGGRDSAIPALRLLSNEISRRNPELKDLLGILEAIEFGLADLRDGVQTPMFQKNVQRDDQSKERRTSTHELWIHGAGSAAVTLLMQSPTKHSEREACNIVAAAFRRAGWRKGARADHSHISDVTVMNWRKKVMAAHARPDELTQQAVRMYDDILDVLRDADSDKILPIIIEFLQERIPPSKQS